MTEYEEALVRYMPRLRGYARSLSRDNPDKADDILQEAMLRAIEYKHLFKPVGDSLEASLRNWFYAILRNTSRKLHKKQVLSRRRENLAAREPTLVPPIAYHKPTKLYVRDVLPWQEYEALLAYVNKDVRRPGDHTYRYRARKRLKALANEDTEIVW